GSRSRDSSPRNARWKRRGTRLTKSPKPPASIPPRHCGITSDAYSERRRRHTVVGSHCPSPGPRRPGVRSGFRPYDAPMPLLTRMMGFLITNDADRATKFYRDVLGFGVMGEDQHAVVFDANGT